MIVYNDTSSVVSGDPALTSIAAQMPSLLLLLHQSISPSAVPTALPTTSTTVATDAGNIDFLLRQQINWYTVIVILSGLVLIGVCFTVCRLVMKATAHEKAGLNWNTDSLLYSRKDSIIPISLHFDQNYDDNGSWRLSNKLWRRSANFVVYLGIGYVTFLSTSVNR